MLKNNEWVECGGEWSQEADGANLYMRMWQGEVNDWIGRSGTTVVYLKPKTGYLGGGGFRELRSLPRLWWLQVTFREETVEGSADEKPSMRVVMLCLGQLALFPAFTLSFPPACVAPRFLLWAALEFGKFLWRRENFTKKFVQKDKFLISICWFILFNWLPFTDYFVQYKQPLHDLVNLDSCH